MNAREIFQMGCQRIYAALEPYGFNAAQKGQTLTKPSKDKRLKFELHFQSSTRNWSGGIAILPFVFVSSPQLKKWQKEKYNSGEEGGGIFTTRLENLTPLKNKNYNWNIALNNQENTIPKLCELIITYVFPLFNKFENADKVIIEIAEKGLRFNEHFDPKDQNLPIDFLCCFGNQELAQKAFDNYLREQKLIGNAKRVFDALQGGKHYAHKFITDMTMEKAFLNNLKING